VINLLNKDLLKDWEFLSNWGSLKDLEKVKYYDKMCCHELNWFAKLKDQEFFEGVVKLFLQNKKEK